MWFRKAKRIKELEKELEEMTQSRNDWKKRFRRAGNAPYVYVPDRNIREYSFEVKNIFWGQWIAVTGDMTDGIIDASKEKLVEKMARCLIDNDLVQFIIKKPEDSFDPLHQFGTIAVKMAVLPWEQRTLMIRKDVAE